MSLPATKRERRTQRKMITERIRKIVAANDNLLNPTGPRLEYFTRVVTDRVLSRMRKDGKKYGD